MLNNDDSSASNTSPSSVQNVTSDDGPSSQSFNSSVLFSAEQLNVAVRAVVQAVGMFTRRLVLFFVILR